MKTIRYIVLALFGFIIFSPILWMILSSFKGVEELWRNPPTVIPLRPTLSGYRTIFERLEFGRYFLNSVMVAVASTTVVCTTSSLSGYIFAKFNFRFRNILFLMILAGMMIPGQVTIIQNYATVRFFGWLNTYWALIVPGGVSIFAIFFMRQFFHSIHDDFIDAARIEGASEFRIFRSVMLPLAQSGVATIAIFSFRGAWDNLLWPLIVISKPSLRTLPMGIAGLATVHTPLMELLLPASTLAVVPVIIVFAFFQQKFVESVAASGIKA